MILGIDIDNTITDTNETVRAYLKQEYPLYEDYKLLPKKEYELFLKKNLKAMRKEYKLKKGVKEAWTYFKEHNFKIIIITARNNEFDDKYIEDTIKFLRVNGLFYDKIYFDEENKGATASKEKVDLFIDDKETNLDNVALYNISCVCLGKSCKYKSFTNWYELLEYIKEEPHG